jgi:hypothetical protein
VREACRREREGFETYGLLPMLLRGCGAGGWVCGAPGMGLYGSLSFVGCEVARAHAGCSSALAPPTAGVESPLLANPLPPTGVIGGLMGSAFNHANQRLAEWRKARLARHGTRARIAEALAIALLTSAISFALPLMAQCQVGARRRWAAWGAAVKGLKATGMACCKPASMGEQAASSLPPAARAPAPARARQSCPGDSAEACPRDAADSSGNFVPFACSSGDEYNDLATLFFNTQVRAALVEHCFRGNALRKGQSRGGGGGRRHWTDRRARRRPPARPHLLRPHLSPPRRTTPSATCSAARPRRSTRCPPW